MVAAGWAGGNAAWGVHPGTGALTAVASWAEGAMMSRMVLESKNTWS